MIFNPIPSLIRAYDQQPILFMVAVAVIILFVWIVRIRNNIRQRNRKKDAQPHN
jgi:hypothetical protein